MHIIRLSLTPHATFGKHEWTTFHRAVYRKALDQAN